MVKKRLNFGFAIKRLREEGGLSQTKLAELSKITQPMMSYIESNKRIPSAQIIGQIAQALGIVEQRIYDLAKENINYKEVAPS